MYHQLELHPDEQLVCLFLRGVGEPANQLAVTDFERRPGAPVHEGGISLFRRDHISFKSMLKRVKRKKSLDRGFAMVTVEQLQALGFHIFGDLEKDLTHVCLHCAECNEAEQDCIPVIGPCPFIVPGGIQPHADDDAIRKKLSETMTVLFEAAPTGQILTIFGKDVDEKDPVAANAIYERRWKEQRKASIKLVE